MRSFSRAAFAALILAAAALVGACASTDTGQGQAEQGGSNGDAPQAVGLMLVFGNPTMSNAPTAAPAARSEAEARSQAQQTTAVDPEKAVELLKAAGLSPELLAPVEAALAAKSSSTASKVVGGEPPPAPATSSPPPAPAGGGQ